MRYIARSARRWARLATRTSRPQFECFAVAVEHDRHDRRLARQPSHRLGWERDPVGGLTQRVCVEAVEHRGVVDVDTDLRHPPLAADRSPDTAETTASANSTSIGVPVLPSCCLTVANWASIADHSLASRSGSKLRWVWCMPDGLSTQRRTDTDAFCLSSSDSPSSPARRLPSSRQRRSNTPTGSTRAKRQQGVLQLAEPLPTGVIQTFGGVGDGVDMTRRHGTPRPARFRSRASARTPRNDPTPLSSHVSSACRTRSAPPPPTPSDLQRPVRVTGGRSPHRPHRPNPAPAAPSPPPHPDQPGHTPRPRPPTAKRSPRRHHDLSSPNPFRPQRSTRGKPDANHPRQGV